MKKIGIVVQRCHESIVGGSEALAWQYATLLRDEYEVDVLTTTALDISDWANVLPEGIEERDGVNLRRFPVTTGRSPYWGALYERLQKDYRTYISRKRRGFNSLRYMQWSVSLQEEFVRHQGPYSEPLMQFLGRRWPDYHTIIFVTYLYPTTYFGLQYVPAHRCLFAPTLHDEVPAYLPIYKHAAHRAHSLIWLTEAERRVGQRLWGELPGRVVAMSIDTKLREPAEQTVPYILYSGRIDPNKGCVEMLDYFIKFKREHPSDLRLVLTGKDDMPVPQRSDIDFRGFVSDEEKFSLMAGAICFVMPSGNESFSIVTLEAMAQGTPVLASGVSEVLIDHVTRSGGGEIYLDYQSFAKALEKMLANCEKLSPESASGRAYVTSKYQPELIRASLIEAIEERPLTTAPEVSISIMPSNSPKLNDDLPLPHGWSEATLRDFVASIQVEGAVPHEVRSYALADFKRFVYTLGLVPERPHLSILELGANPYFTSVLIKKFRDAELHLANYFGGDSEKGDEQEGFQNVFIHQTGDVMPLTYKHFNMEQDAFPYPDAAFDVVLFCEIIEHLLCDPVHALTEIKRALKIGGSLIVTTPNVARLDNVCKLVAGENIYDPYSGFGPYGRHNREYTRLELMRLLEANGFQIETSFTTNVHEVAATSYDGFEKLATLVEHRQSDLGQYIFCRCVINQNSKQSKAVRPEWLYRSLHKPFPRITLASPAPED